MAKPAAKTFTVLSLGHRLRKRRATAGEAGPLLERGVDRGELRIQVAAEAVDRSNNRDRNARSDQSVFNRGSARLVS